MDDVRDLRGRIARGFVAIWCGVAGAIGAYHLTAWMSRGATTAQGDFFVFASSVVGFLIAGTAGGIVHARCSERPSQVPLAIVLRRARGIP